MRKSGITIFLLMAFMAQAQARTPLDDFYGQPTCRQKLGLKVAERYVGWCLEWTMSRLSPCDVNNPCAAILSPVVTECDDQRHANIDHPIQRYREMSNCIEARQIYVPDRAEMDRRRKAYDGYVAKHPGKPMTAEDWRKLAP
jgi:hypothetical protein